MNKILFFDKLQSRPPDRLRKMANLRRHDNAARMAEASCCKCSKSDQKMKKQPSGAPYLEDAVSKFEERRGDLVNRQQHLTEKITTMERCIPALMAFNMWTSGRNCDDPPLCKVRQIMNKLSPNSDPTEKLVERLKTTVKSLNTETAELHEKIIEADIALEESGMELDSIVLANEEFEGKLKSLERELKKNETPSLTSINSEDLICLSKIRQLGEEQVVLKNSIRDLEEREAMFHEQMNRLLTSKEFRKASCGTGSKKKIQELECPMHEQQYEDPRPKKKSTMKQKEFVGTEGAGNSAKIVGTKSEEKRNHAKPHDPNSATASGRDNAEQGIKQSGRFVSDKAEFDSSKTTSVSTGCHDKSSCPKTSKPSKSHTSRSDLAFCNACAGFRSRQPQRLQQRGCSPKTCGLRLVAQSNLSRDQVCDSCCKASGIIAKPSGLRSKSGKADPRRQRPATCELDDSPCRKCESSTPCKECLRLTMANLCRCSCKGKCAIGESDVPCNCAEYLNSDDDPGYQPSGDTAKINDLSSSTDDEYCECCDCGCEDSDESSDACQC